tara:strand:- start:2200 stop:2505 length:306 start_codon:yes stop_codon:yes gene_type:complete
MTDQSPHNTDAPKSGDGRKYWLDNPKNVDKVYWSVILVSVLLFFADALYHKHPEFGIEKVFGFYGLYGFVACVGLVLAAKGMRVLLMRDEDYYDDTKKGDS